MSRYFLFVIAFVFTLLLVVGFWLINSQGLVNSYAGTSGYGECAGSYDFKGFNMVRLCEEKDFNVQRINDGFLAEIQGHARGTDGEVSYGFVGYDVNMQGHYRDTSC